MQKTTDTRFNRKRLNLRKKKITLRNSGLISLFAASSLFFNVSPALAAQAITGAGAGIGYEVPGNQGPNCVPDIPLMGTLSRSSFELDHVGDYTAVDTFGTPLASYTGPSQMQIEVGPHVISPEGTFITCFVPGPVPISSWKVNSPATPGGAGVSCAGTVGTYQRRAFDVVEFRLFGLCTVKGGNGVTVQNVENRHVVTGEMHPCALPSPPFPEPIETGTCAGEPEAGSQLETAYVVGGLEP